MRQTCLMPPTIRLTLAISRPIRRMRYGCMQIHNHDAKQTLLALNHWVNGNAADLGIGNQPSGQPDWTLSPAMAQTLSQSGCVCLFIIGSRRSALSVERLALSESDKADIFSPSRSNSHPVLSPLTYSGARANQAPGHCLLSERCRGLTLFYSLRRTNCRITNSPTSFHARSMCVQLSLRRRHRHLNAGFTLISFGVVKVRRMAWPAVCPAQDPYDAAPRTPAGVQNLAVIGTDPSRQVSIRGFPGYIPRKNLATYVEAPIPALKQ